MSVRLCCVSVIGLRYILCMLQHFVWGAVFSGHSVLMNILQDIRSWCWAGRLLLQSNITTFNTLSRTKDQTQDFPISYVMTQWFNDITELPSQSVSQCSLVAVTDEYAHHSVHVTQLHTDWLIEQGLTSPPTQYRLYGRRAPHRHLGNNISYPGMALRHPGKNGFARDTTRCSVRMTPHRRIKHRNKSLQR